MSPEDSEFESLSRLLSSIWVEVVGLSDFSMIGEGGGDSLPFKYIPCTVLVAVDGLYQPLFVPSLVSSFPGFRSVWWRPPAVSRGAFDTSPSG